MSIQDLRYPSTNELKKIVAATAMVNPVFAQDDRGHFIASWDSMHPLVEALPEHVERPPVQEKAPTKRQGRKGNGTCGMIREWVIANPQATKEDAVAHFPHLNPITVKVQFGHARKGE